MFGWFKRRPTGTLQLLTLKIEGMHCGQCVNRVTATLERLPGVQVERVEVGSASLRWDSAETSEDALIGALAAAGFGAEKAVPKQSP